MNTTQLQEVDGGGIFEYMYGLQLAIIFVDGVIEGLKTNTKLS